MRAATDEHGDDDTHCIQCGARRPAPLFVRAAALADIASENRQRSARRSLARRDALA